MPAARRTSPRRGIPLRHGAPSLLAVLTLLAPTAHAQRLNLDVPRAPAAGESPASLAIKSTLTDAAIGPSADPWIPGHQLGAIARSRTQALAHALISRAEELGEPGSIHFALAALLAERLWIEDLITVASAPGGEPIAAALRAYIHAIEQALAESSKLPPTVGELDVLLRSIFAPLAESCADRLPERHPIRGNSWGWTLPRTPQPPAGAAPTPPAPTIPALRAQLDAVPETALDAATIAELRAMLDALEEAATLRTFHSAAAEAASLIAAALPATLPAAPEGTAAPEGNAAGLPNWFAEARRAIVAERTASALRRFAVSARDEDAAAALTAAAGIIRLAAAAETITPGGGQSPRDVQSLRLSFCDAAADAMGDPGPARERGRKSLRALERALELIAERATLGADGDVARELRVSFRALETAAKKSESLLIAQLAPIARAESATSQPAIVAAIAGHRRALDDLKMLRSVDAVLSRHREGDSPIWRLASTRLLKLGQDVGRAESADASLLALRSFASALELVEPMPGEAAVRAGGEAIAALTGGKADQLAARLDEWRAAYLESWAREGEAAPSRPRAPSSPVPTTLPPPDDIAAQLRALRQLLALIGDAHTLHALATPGAQRDGLRAWPALPLSTRALAFIAGGDELAQQLAAATTLALDPAQTEPARRAIRQIELARPTLRLLAAIDRAARDRHAQWIWPFVVAAVPPVRSGWLVPERARLAAIDRYLEDAAATPAEDARDAAAIMAYVDDLAKQVLEAGLDR